MMKNKKEMFERVVFFVNPYAYCLLDNGVAIYTLQL